MQKAAATKKFGVTPKNLVTQPVCVVSSILFYVLDRPVAHRSLQRRAKAVEEVALAEVARVLRALGARRRSLGLDLAQLFRRHLRVWEASYESRRVI